MSVINETFAEQLTLRDGFVMVMTTTAGGGAAIEMRIGDQADPGMTDFSDPGFHALVSQVPVEMVITPTDQKARVSQVVVEFVSKTAQGSLRGAQITMVIN